MDLFNIIIIVLLIALFITYKNNKFDNFKNTTRSKKCTKNKNNKNNVCNQDDNINQTPPPKKKINFGRTFAENQYHNDYRDVLETLLRMSSGKVIFNRSDKEITIQKVNYEAGLNLINDFIQRINNTLTPDVDAKWKTKKSGWETVQESLGLPPSLYGEPTYGGHVYLVKIDDLAGYATEGMVRIECVLTLQKTGVDDQIIIKVQFCLDNRNNDFDPSKNTVPRDIVIENIFIVGFLLKNENIGFTNGFDFYDYHNIDVDLEKGETTDPQEIVKALTQKRMERFLENQNFTNILNDEDKENRLGVPCLSTLPSFQDTRTIYDDLNNYDDFNKFNHKM